MSELVCPTPTLGSVQTQTAALNNYMLSSSFQTRSFPALLFSLIGVSASGMVVAEVVVRQEGSYSAELRGSQSTLDQA